MRAINRRLDASIVGGLVAKLPGAGVADDLARVLRDEQPMTRCAGVLLEPFDALPRSKWREIERDWRVDHVVVVNLHDTREIVAHRRPDFHVLHRRSSPASV